MGIGLFWNGGNQKNLALALLRAGGVDIPDDPLRSSPTPESFQAMRVFSSDSEESSDSPPPAPKPVVQAMRVFSSEPGEGSPDPTP